MMSATRLSWLQCLLPSNWMSKVNQLIPSGLELEKIVILFISIILLPTILGAILGIIWNIIWVMIVAFVILFGSVIIFKFLLPKSPCSAPDMIVSILVSGGLTIPSLILDGISSTMSIANLKRMEEPAAMEVEHKKLNN